MGNSYDRMELRIYTHITRLVMGKSLPTFTMSPERPPESRRKSVAAAAASYIHHRVDLTALFNVPQEHFLIAPRRNVAGILKVTG